MRFIYTKQFVYFFSLFTLTCIIIFMQFRGWLNPIESFAAEIPRPIVYIFSASGHGISSFFSFFSSVPALNRTNAQLQDQVRQLQEQNATLSQDQLENQILKQELDFRNTSKIEVISGTVIANDPTGFSQTMTINIGSKDGVAIGKGVLSQGVFIGVISSVSTMSAKVTLVTDPQSVLDAELNGTNDSGILRGSSGSGIILDTISQKAQVSPGQEIVTAGLTNGIPKGILIGTVDKVESQKNDLLQSVSVISAVDLRQVYFVSVIQ